MPKDAGYSLTELMTVIAILAILAAIAIPGYMGWRSNAQLSGASRDLYSSFQKAKLEAIRRNTTCAVWFRGTADYVMYVEPDDAPYPYDGDEEVISTTRWSNYPGAKLDLTQGNGDGADNDGLLLASPNDRVFFAPDGLPRNNAGGLGSVTVFLSNQAGSRKTTVSVSTAGNVHINQTGF
jgi:prepilin-type N-terminal cleavage/methylation domain-containing protein